jgi:hypothetical protein
LGKGLLKKHSRSVTVLQWRKSSPSGQQNFPHNQRNPRLRNQSKAQQAKSKNPFFSKILTPFFASSYENQESRIKNFFRLKRAGSPYYGMPKLRSRNFDKFILSAALFGIS